MKTIPKPKNQWIMRALKSTIIKEIVRQGALHDPALYFIGNPTVKRV